MNNGAQAAAGARAFGAAIDALLTYLGAPGGSASGRARLDGAASATNVAAGPRFPSVRVLAFLSGAPDTGVGEIDSIRWVDAEPMLFPVGVASASDATLEAALTAADALAAPQTDLYTEAGARAAVRPLFSVHACVSLDVLCLIGRRVASLSTCSPCLLARP